MCFTTLKLYRVQRIERLNKTGLNKIIDINFTKYLTTAKIYIISDGEKNMSVKSFSPPNTLKSNGVK